MDEDIKTFMMIMGALIAAAIVFATICLIGAKVTADIEIQKAEAGILNCEEKKGE